MLVIARKAGEAIRIAEDIEIVVLAIEGQRVRLGVRAPRSMRVLRAELEGEVAGANQQSALRRDEASAELLARWAAQRRDPAAKETPPPDQPPPVPPPQPAPN